MLILHQNSLEDMPRLCMTCLVAHLRHEIRRKLLNRLRNFLFYGAVEWTRTTDLLITNQLLYQLSYNSNSAWIITTRAVIKKQLATECE